jgi:hypothetical protein
VSRDDGVGGGEAARSWRSQLLPANDSSNAVHDAIASVPSGAGWLASLLNTAAGATAGHGTAIAIVMAALSAAIGVAVLRDWHAKPFLILAIVISLVFWVVGQGFGGVLTGEATDVSTAPLMIHRVDPVGGQARGQAATGEKSTRARPFAKRGGPTAGDRLKS